MPNQIVKTGLKAKKIKLPQMNLFLAKQLIKFSWTYWPLSFCKFLKKFLGRIQSYEDVPFLGPKWPICPEQNFFGTNHYYYFHLPIGPFHCAKFEKNLTVDPDLWRCAIFGPKMVHLPQFIYLFIFLKIINITLIFLLASFIMQNFKKFFQWIQLWGCTFFGPKMTHFPKWYFFQKTCWQALFLSFMPIYMWKIKVRY